jgi:hypothetical protein
VMVGQSLPTVGNTELPPMNRFSTPSLQIRIDHTLARILMHSRRSHVVPATRHCGLGIVLLITIDRRYDALPMQFVPK